MVDGTADIRRRQGYGGRGEAGCFFENLRKGKGRGIDGDRTKIELNRRKSNKIEQGEGRRQRLWRAGGGRGLKIADRGWRNNGPTNNEDKQIAGGLVKVVRQCAKRMKDLLDSQQFDFEHQRAVWWNKRAGAIRSVGEVRRNLEFEFVTDFHELETFGPTGNHAIQGKTDGFAALDGAVEDRSVEQRAVIMDFHGVGGFGRSCARAFLHHSIFQTGCRGHRVGGLGRAIRCRGIIAANQAQSRG